MQAIIYQTAQGAAICYPNPEAGLSIHEIVQKDIPPGVPFRIVDASTIPTDRTFRNAWDASGGSVVVDMPKAREIAHSKRREARSAEFAPLDDLIAKKIPGTDEAAAEAQRQGIRDKYNMVQQGIDAALTPEELKAALGV